LFFAIYAEYCIVCIQNFYSMSRADIMIDVDPSGGCAVKAHQHAVLAKELSDERKYEEAAKEHAHSRAYFRDAKKMLQKEDPDTAAALGLLSYHHKLKMRDMQKRAKAELRSNTNSGNINSLKKDSSKSSSNKSKEKEKESLADSAQTANSKSKSKEKMKIQTATTTATMEIKRVLGGFKDLLSMENKMKNQVLVQRGDDNKKKNSMYNNNKEDDFFVVDARRNNMLRINNSSDNYKTKTKANTATDKSNNDIRQMSDKLKEISKENLELKKTIHEFRSKFGILKKAMEHFKQAWSDDLSNKYQSEYEEQVTQLKRQYESEKAKRIKAQQELDRYVRYVAKSKSQK